MRDVERDAVYGGELAEALMQVADADGRSRGHRFDGLELDERTGHERSLEPSICRAEASFTTGYFPGGGRGPCGGKHPQARQRGGFTQPRAVRAQKDSFDLFLERNLLWAQSLLERTSFPRKHRTSTNEAQQ
jgi:hypothetical protein